jgi:hypothetical protein
MSFLLVSIQEVRAAQTQVATALFSSNTAEATLPPASSHPRIVGKPAHIALPFAPLQSTGLMRFEEQGLPVPRQ